MVTQNKCSAAKNSGGFFRRKRRKKQLCFFFRGLFCVIENGQCLICLMKCVGAKCTKRCCRVQQRSAQRFSLCVLSFGIGVLSLLTPNSSLLTNCAPAMRSEQFGAVHFIIGSRLIYILCVKSFRLYALRKSLKGGLCDKNVLPQSVRVCGYIRLC